MCILITAFPMRVAPKKVQKGTRKCPQVIPARSNRGFGMLKRWRIGLRGGIEERRPCSCQDAKEADPLHQLLDAILGSLKPEEKFLFISDLGLRHLSST